jgi:dihydroflavonol-4-reductase
MQAARNRRTIMTGLSSSPVLVTGATGYIAGVLIRELVQQGITVHATVRDISKPERFRYLQDVVDELKGTIRFFEADLQQKGSFAEAMHDCSIVFHTASPFILQVKDAKRDLIDPAVQGTEIVLQQACQTPSVRRVVLTSSAAALCADNWEGYTSNHVVNETNWNRTATLQYQPYSLSKTLAEQAAWVIAGSQTQWSMVTMNPTVVMGPGLKYHEMNECFRLLQQLTSVSRIPRVGMGVVDVRDVARAHILAAFSSAANGRFLLSGDESTDLVQIANRLRRMFPDFHIPQSVVPKSLFWLVAPFFGVQRKFVENMVDIPRNVDTTKSKEILGMEYRPLDDTLRDMFQQVIDHGGVVKTT